MAVDGTEASGDNPFSFKSFVKRTSTDAGAKGGSGGREGGRKKSSHDAGSLPFPEEGDDNPFSFKQFVRKKTLTGGDEGSSSSDAEHSLSNSLDKVAPVPAHSTEHPLAPLHSSNATINSKDKRTKTSSKSLSSKTSSTGKGGRKSKKQKDTLFSDTDSDSDSFTTSSQDISLPFPSRVAPADTQGLGLTIDPLCVLEEEKADETVGVLRLSDSSDDSVVMMTRGQGSSNQSTESPHQAEKLKQQCSQLATENKQLKMELETFKVKYQKEKQKNGKLREQLQSLKKKEAEETKALEDIVAKVEENLVTSTNKAVAAEGIIAKLKQEIQSLQAQLSHADAQSVHRHYEEVLSGVRDKATYASRQLSMASMAADQSIRELLSGVDTLKNIAEVLQFIDRISEVKQR